MSQPAAQRAADAARQRLEAALAAADQAKAFVENVRGEVEHLDAKPLEPTAAARISAAERVLADARALAGDARAQAGALDAAERQVVVQAGELRRLQNELAAKLGSLRRRHQLLRGAIAELRAESDARSRQLAAGSAAATELRRLVELAAQINERTPVPALERLRIDLRAALAAAPAAAPSTQQSAPATPPRPSSSAQAGATRPGSGGAGAASPIATAQPAGSSPPRADAAAVPLGDDVPVALVEAAEALFAADYGRTLRLLESLPVGDPRVEAARHLLGAAASFALYERGGREDPRLLDTARSHGIACRRALPELALDGLPFSPPFRAFFRSLPAPPPVEPAEG